MNNTKSLEIVRSIPVKRYGYIPDWLNFTHRETETDFRTIGFIAQDVEALVPEAVSTISVFDRPIPGSTQRLNLPNFKRLDKERLIPVLWSALQEAVDLIENLEARVSVLEAS